MKLNEIIKDSRVLSLLNLDNPLEISHLSASSSACKQGSLFFCLSGTSVDGHAYAEEAVGNGAVALVVERPLPIPTPQVVVENSRTAMSIMSATFYKNPARSMKLVGITGTNGKTTTSHILRNIARAAGYKTGMIGTTAIYIDNIEQPPLLTTPDPIDLHRILARMKDAGVDLCIMEVSAHALALNKLDGITFDIAAFTNLTQDHLDFFGNMNAYKDAKKRLFSPSLCRIAVVNVDDDCGMEISRELNGTQIPCYTYGCDSPADVFAINYSAGTYGQKYLLNAFDNITDIAFRLPGRFNMYNTLCAATIGYRLGATLSQIACAIAAMEFVPGRFNVINGGNFSVIVDYAHTPDGLKNILTCVEEIAQGRIITVFGCGGERDKEKRAEMGRIAGECSDFTIITSDNPRHENPLDIMEQIELGIKRTGAKYVKIASRPAAIEYAVSIASARDIIILAGKGDERYLDIMGVKTPYYDVDEVKRAIKLRS